MGMFSNPAPAADDLKNLVEVSLSELARLQETSPIAARGVQLLSTLLLEANQHRQAAASRSPTKRKRSAPLGEEDNFGNVAKRVSNSVQTSPPSSSSTSLSPSTHLPFVPYYPTIPSPNVNNFDSLLSTTSTSFTGYNGMEIGVAEGETDLEFWRLLEGFQTPGENANNHPVESGTWSS